MAEKATTELTTGASTPRSGDSAVIIPEALDSEALEEVAASAEKGIFSPSDPYPVVSPHLIPLLPPPHLAPEVACARAREPLSSAFIRIHA